MTMKACSSVHEYIYIHQHDFLRESNKCGSALTVWRAENHTLREPPCPMPTGLAFKAPHSLPTPSPVPRCLLLHHTHTHTNTAYFPSHFRYTNRVLQVLNPRLPTLISCVGPLTHDLLHLEHQAPRSTHC